VSFHAIIAVSSAVSSFCAFLARGVEVVRFAAFFAALAPLVEVFPVFLISHLFFFSRLSSRRASSVARLFQFLNALTQITEAGAGIGQVNHHLLVVGIESPQFHSDLFQFLSDFHQRGARLFVQRARVV
jgi:hypothetical protein